jgi:2,4-dienoyl-CoA reductase-like NADH-dependent reductase (Old Yellow Enzyme family)
MTRGFADPNHCCTDEIAAYYTRRAEDGVALILTEGIIIDPGGDGYRNVPHLYTDPHAESWKRTVRQVQAAGSKIFAQLWHCGRISHPDFTGGLAPVSSTDKPAAGMNRQNDKPFGVPRALRTEEMPDLYQMYVNSADKAFQAGFDGVEIHMGHGYLIDQFFDARINERTDIYGGSVENRCRLAVELIDILIRRYGPDKVMIRISPSREMGGLYEWPDLDDMLDYFIRKVDALGLGLLDVSCANADYFQTSGKVMRSIRPMWPHFLMGGASLSLDQANQEMEAGWIDMVTWGRYILANPDFVTRARTGQEWLGMTNEMRAVLL